MKNRNKISIEYAKLAEDLQFIAKALGNCRPPESHFAADVLSFC